MADSTLTSDFQPVTTSDFTPVDQPTSAITAKPVPTSEQRIQAGKDVAAGAVRYGVPIAAGIANPSLAIPNLIAQSLIVGGSEVAARRIERAESDPHLDTLWSDLKAGGAVGALDFGVNLAFRGLGSAMHAIGRKLLIPAEMPYEVRVAQETLGELENAPMTAKQPGKLKRFMQFVTHNGGKRPFSLTYGQINAEEQRFIGWLEGVARAGIGSRGKMVTFDLRNEKAIEGLIRKYVDSRATEATGPEFAAFAKRIIGDMKSEKGEMFLPVVAYRKYLYTQFENAMAQSGNVVDGTKLRRFIMNNELAEEGLTKKIYGALRSEGLVPPLESTAKTQQSFRRTTSEKIGGMMGESTGAAQREDLLTGHVAQSADVSKAVRFSSTRTQNITRSEVESLVGPSEEEIANEWRNLQLADTDKIIKTFNSFWEDDVTKGSKAKRINRILQRMRAEIEPTFEKSLGPEATKLRNAANAFFGKEQDFMHDVAVNALRKTLSRNPAKAMSLLGGGTTAPNAKVTYDRLLALKQALNFSAETPRVGEALSRATSASGFPAGAEAMHEMYDKTFLRPLRYQMIANSVDHFGRFEPDKFLQMLNRGSDVPEYFDEVFGGAAQVDEIKRLMTTLSVLKQKGPEKNIFIQLAQAGALTGGISTAIFSDDPEVKMGGLASGAAIFLGPYALARMLTNPAAVRAFTDGIEAGVRSGRFAMGLRRVAEMKVASGFFRDEPTNDGLKYYTTMPMPGNTPPQ